MAEERQDWFDPISVEMLVDLCASKGVTIGGSEGTLVFAPDSLAVVEIRIRHSWKEHHPPHDAAWKAMVKDMEGRN